MTEALNNYLEQRDKDYERQGEEEEYEDICGYCGCIMPDNGTPCPCEEREDE